MDEDQPDTGFDLEVSALRKHCTTSFHARPGVLLQPQITGNEGLLDP